MMDALVSVDLSVEDPDGAAERLVSVLGLPRWKPSWVHDLASSQYRAYFLRPQPNRAIAPTAIEVIGPHPVGGWSAGLKSIHLLQGERPMKTHNSVFAVPDVDAYHRRLTDASIPHIYDPGTPELPFGKLWVGQSTAPGGGVAYDPSTDGGLFIELVPTAALRLPADASHPPSDPEVVEGAVVRAAARSFIVSDLDATLGAMEKTLGWSRPAVTSEKSDCRVATYVPSLPGSAVLEILEPVSPEGRIAEHQARYGPGAYRITFEVNGLEAAAQQLRQRGAAFAFEEGGDRIGIDPVAMGGLIVDLVGRPSA